MYFIEARDDLWESELHASLPVPALIDFALRAPLSFFA